tara:strand:- start:6846 stop:7052 length:207 start_codon:yes stop_codon:yes gene_type:complete
MTEQKISTKNLTEYRKWYYKRNKKKLQAYQQWYYKSMKDNTFVRKQPKFKEDANVFNIQKGKFYISFE